PPEPAVAASVLTAVFNGAREVPAPVAEGMARLPPPTSVIPAAVALRMAPVTLSVVVPVALITVVTAPGGVPTVRFEEAADRARLTSPEVVAARFTVRLPEVLLTNMLPPGLEMFAFRFEAAISSGLAALVPRLPPSGALRLTVAAVTSADPSTVWLV